MLPTVNPQPPFATNPRQNDSPDRATPDPDFGGAFINGTLSSWDFSPSSGTWSFGAGALSGGKAVCTATSIGGRPFIEAKRLLQGYDSNRVPWRDRGPPANLSIRWRRVNSLYDAVSEGVNAFVAIDWSGSDGVSATKLIFNGSVTSADRIYVNAFAPNSWHSVVFSSQPAPGTIQASMPRLTVYATSGTVEFDHVDGRQL